MVSLPAIDRRRALGDFLQAHRARLSPAALGFAGGTRRRTPGLRREEIAQLAGLSATWYTWIEQGREVSVSPAALARLAKTLQLSPAERIYLFDLAGKRDPRRGRPRRRARRLPPWQPPSGRSRRRPMCSTGVGMPWPGMRRPAGSSSAGSTGPRDKTAERNLLRFIFLEPAARRLIRGWRSARAASWPSSGPNAAPFRRIPACRAWPEELRGKSSLFVRFWDEHAVLGREGGLRQFNHPHDGLLAYRAGHLCPSPDGPISSS